MATRISRANGSPTLTTKCTFSAWVKRTDSAINNSGRDCGIIETYTGANDYGWIRFDGNDQIQIYARNSSGNLIVCDTVAKFRDPAAWYHIVATLDSTESTSSDRVKLYVNGVRQDFQGSPTYPSGEVWFNRNSATFNIGNSEKYTSNFQFDGMYSHVHFIDGLAYQASTFGETDSATGIWKINTNPTVTYGNNGFFLFKNDASLNDDSGNGNNFTLNSGSVLTTVDNPSNNFSVINSIVRTTDGTYSNGNNTFTQSQNAWHSGFGTIAMEKGAGKYYIEFKGLSGTKFGFGISDFKNAGVFDRSQRGENRYVGEYANSYGYHYGGTFYYSGSSTSSGYDSFTSSNVIGMAVDMENMKIYFAKDGTWQNSSNPSSGSGGYTIVDPLNCYFPTISVEAASASMNAGNGIFGTTAISSEGTNASNIGKFEYDVPTGYTALSTKGLNE